jgi:hypothetical protein
LRLAAIDLTLCYNTCKAWFIALFLDYTVKLT